MYVSGNNAVNRDLDMRANTGDYVFIPLALFKAVTCLFSKGCNGVSLFSD